jgi:predicted ATPase/DNA-binding SARP family transcriptional activator
MLKVRLFGHLEVWDTNQPISKQRWGRHKNQSLFKILASQRGHVFTQDQLIDLLFPDLQPDKALRNLQARISRLRRILEPELQRGTDSCFIVRVEHAYYIPSEAPCWIDIDKFRALTHSAQDSERLKQWENALAEDVYEEWSIGVRERLRDEMLGALEGSANCQAVFGHYTEAIARLQQVIALDRYRETAYRNLMRYGWYTGASELAVQTFEQCKQALVELQVSPAPETQQVFDQIKTGQLEKPSTNSQVRQNGLTLESDTEVEAEKRQLTLLTCRFDHNSHDLADLETLHAMFLTLRGQILPILRHFQGTVIQYFSDKMIVAFAYPIAQEDSAQRALAAGVSIIQEIHKLKQRQPEFHRASICVQIGIDSSMSMISAMSPVSIIGNAPKISEALMDIADDDGIVVSDRFARLISNLNFEELKPITIEGLSKPVQALNVILPKSSALGIDEASPSTTMPFVGRTGELKLLNNGWAKAKRGQNQSISITGEAGIGKTRLIQAFIENLGKREKVFVCRGSHLHRRSTLHPIVTLLRSALKLEVDDWPSFKKRFILMGLSKAEAAVLAPFFSISIPLDITPQAPNPMAQLEIQHHALETLLFSSGQAPVLFIFEDLHWMDPTTLCFLSHLMLQVKQHSFMAIFTFRPEEFEPAPGLFDHTKRIELNTFDLSQLKVLVDQILHHTLPDEVYDVIAAKTDGVPLFIEEFTRALVEDGLLETTNVPSKINIPDTLNDWLMSRLDRIQSAKSVVQEASVLGKEFSFELLSAVSALDESQLQIELQCLIKSHILVKNATAPDEQFRFRHTLIQEAAYESLLTQKRKRLHKKVAETLLNQFLQLSKTQPELVAYHFTEAREDQHAIKFWTEAGQQAIAKTSYTEAIQYFNQALSLIQNLPESAQLDQLELELLVTLGGPLIATQGFASPQIERNFARARTLCFRMKQDNSLHPVLSGLSTFYFVRAKFPIAHEIATLNLQLAKRTRVPAQLEEAHRIFGIICNCMGQFKSATDHLLCAMQHYQSLDIRPEAGFAEIDAQVSTLSWLATACTYLGEQEKASDYGDKAWRLAKQIKHPHSEAFCLHILIMSAQLETNLELVEQLCNAQIELSGKHGFSFWQAYGQFHQGWVLTSNQEKGIQLMISAIDAYRLTGAQSLIPYFLTLLAEAEARLREVETGINRINEAIENIECTQERFYEAEVYRMKADLTLRLPGDYAGEAEIFFHEAINISRRQGAKFLEKRASQGLANLWIKQEKTHEAKRLMAHFG